MWFTRCRDAFVNFRDRGTLRGSDGHIIDELAGELEGCRQQLERLADDGE